MAMQKLILGMAVAMIAVGMVSAQKCEVVEDWKIPTGEYRVSDLYINGPSFGIWTDTYEHKEYSTYTTTQTRMVTASALSSACTMYVCVS